jgi:integrase
MGSRALHRLSALDVERAKPDKAKRRNVLVDGGGLYLITTRQPGGHITKAWTFRWELFGQRGEIGLGALHTVGLAEAREAARLCRLDVHAKRSPLDVKRAREIAAKEMIESRKTFEEVSALCIEANEPSWSAAHLEAWRSTLRRYCGAINGKPVADLVQADVLKVISPIWTRHHVTATRLLDRIGVVCKYARAHGYREAGDPTEGCRDVLAKNKRGRIHRVEHFEAVPFDEVHSVLTQLGEIGTPGALACAFGILTAARPGEVTGATWSEIDRKAQLWTIPASRMKAGKPHRVPLSGAALALLDRMEQGAPGDAIFGCARKGPLRALRRLPGCRGASAHGFRSSFRTWCGERTSFARNVIELSLAHIVTLDQTEQAYYRDPDLIESRRKLMEAWAGFCTTPAAATGNVVAIRK